MNSERTKTIAAAQQVVKDFAKRNGWRDIPNIDKFDHLHEELLEMSQHLRYKDEAARIATIQEKHQVFVDGIGDTLFALCRLANELSVDVEEAFNFSKNDILAKYNEQSEEKNVITRTMKLDDGA